MKHGSAQTASVRATFAKEQNQRSELLQHWRTPHQDTSEQVNMKHLLGRGHIYQATVNVFAGGHKLIRDKQKLS